MCMWPLAQTVLFLSVKFSYHSTDGLFAELLRLLSLFSIAEGKEEQCLLSWEGLSQTTQATFSCDGMIPLGEV